MRGRKERDTIGVAAVEESADYRRPLLCPLKAVAATNAEAEAKAATAETEADGVCSTGVGSRCPPAPLIWRRVPLPPLPTEGGGCCLGGGSAGAGACAAGGTGCACGGGLALLVLLGSKDGRGATVVARVVAIAATAALYPSTVSR